MAELNFKQITDRLNEEFTGENRKLIFWYDANAEFADDVDSMALENAELLRLEPDNQFAVKYRLERQDTKTNFLIYAPFPKPDIRENHLADTLLYSKEFFADRASLLCLDLGIEERLRPTVQKYISFFQNKARTQAFYGLEVDHYTESAIETAIMAVLCKCKSASFEDVVRCLLASEPLNDSPYLAEFEKYGLLDAFWKHCEEDFGYIDPQPTLERLVMTLFATYTARSIHGDVPAAWKPFKSYKPGSVVAFVENLMNSLVYAELFDRLSEQMYRTLNAEKVLGQLALDELVDCCAFAEVDQKLIQWMIDRLVAEDVEAKLGDKTIPAICQDRQKRHFGRRFQTEYEVLKNAHALIRPGIFHPVSGIDAVARDYVKRDYQIDRWYRRFYYHFDRLDDNSAFEELRQRVESIYTNDYLNQITANWSCGFVDDEGDTQLDKQLDFYARYIRDKKERIVVIISDALRFEVGQSIYERLLTDERCEVKLNAMQSVLPSITSFGMAALLPHKRGGVTIGDDYKVLCDGKPCADLKQREAILQAAKPHSRAVQYDEIKMLTTAELRQIISGLDVLYVYHNQIDARGDKLSTENEVFTACEEAVNEIVKLIKDLTSKANTSHYIITADHGFIYKRDKLQESDKISGLSKGGKRYMIASEPVNTEGVVNIPMKSYLPDEDENRFFCTPMGSDLFKAPGSGLNYVHGGCSPQEMIIPVLEIRTEKARVSTRNTSIDLVSLTNKITNLTTNLDFLQTEPVSDTVKETTCRVYFEDNAGVAISNTIFYRADSTEAEAAKRIFRLKFAFKNQAYTKQKKYYLVAVDGQTGLELLRKEVIMDLPFARDFGFGV